MEPLDSDAVTAVRVRDALARLALGERWPAGGRALARERELAWHLHGLYPQLGSMILAGYEFHRRAVRWAVAGGDERFPVPPSSGVIIAGAGLPPPGLPLHSRGAVANPKARFTYTAPVPWLADVIAQELAAVEPDRVSVVLARSLDPDAVLGAGPAAELLAAGPVSVHLALSPARWAPDVAPGVVARYAGLVPAGSTVCISLLTGDPGPAGARMFDDASLTGGRGYRHSPADVESWFTGAGMVLHPDGVRPVRAFRQDWAVRYLDPPGTPGQMIGTAAVKPGDG